MTAEDNKESDAAEQESQTVSKPSEGEVKQESPSSPSAGTDESKGKSENYDRFVRNKSKVSDPSVPVSN